MQLSLFLTQKLFLNLILLLSHVSPSFTREISRPIVKSPSRANDTLPWRLKFVFSLPYPTVAGLTNFSPAAKPRSSVNQLASALQQA
jgi:hypothetical protein